MSSNSSPYFFINIYPFRNVKRILANSRTHSACAPITFHEATEFVWRKCPSKKWGQTLQTLRTLQQILRGTFMIEKMNPKLLYYIYEYIYNIMKYIYKDYFLIERCRFYCNVRNANFIFRCKLSGIKYMKRFNNPLKI